MERSVVNALKFGEFKPHLFPFFDIKEKGFPCKKRIKSILNCMQTKIYQYLRSILVL